MSSPECSGSHESTCLEPSNSFFRVHLCCMWERDPLIKDKCHTVTYVVQPCSSRSGQHCNMTQSSVQLVLEQGHWHCCSINLLVNLCKTWQPSFQIYSTVARKSFWTWLPACCLALRDSKDFCRVSDQIATLVDTTVPSGKWFEWNPKSLRFPDPHMLPLSVLQPHCSDMSTSLL